MASVSVSTYMSTAVVTVLVDPVKSNVLNQQPVVIVGAAAPEFNVKLTAVDVAPPAVVPT